MKNNLDFQREGILASAREKLTKGFEAGKKLEIHDAISELGESDNKEVYEKMANNLPELIRKALPGSFVLSPELRKEIKGISEVYFRLGEKMAPLYTAFADWIHEKIGAKENAVIIFEGRDSLGFLIAYKRRYEGNGTKCLFAPTSRAAVISHYIDETQTGQTEKEQDRVVDFYKLKELAGKNLYFVDFGFRGTIPRLEQLILEEYEQPRPKRINVLLFKKRKSPVMYGESSPMRDKAFKKLGKTELNQIDEKNLKNVEGFLDGAEASGGHLNISPDSEEGDDFYMVLQELASYIKEAREDALVRPSERTPHETSLAITSVQALIAKYSFFNGLKGSNLKDQTTSKEAAVDEVNYFFKLYKKYPVILGILKDINWNIGTSEKYKKLIEDINQDLLAGGMNRIIT